MSGFIPEDKLVDIILRNTFKGGAMPHIDSIDVIANMVNRCDKNAPNAIKEITHINQRCTLAAIYLVHTGEFIGDGLYDTNYIFNRATNNLVSFFGKACLAGVIDGDKFLRRVDFTTGIGPHVPYSLPAEFLFKHKVGRFLLNLWYETLIDEHVVGLCHLSLFFSRRIYIGNVCDYKIELLKCSDTDTRSLLIDVLALQDSATIPSRESLVL